MPASYPGTTKVFTTKVDVSDRVLAEHVNTLQDEVIAVESILGLNPHISSASNPGGVVRTTTFTYATVSDRIANLENGIVGDVHDQYVKKSGGSVIWAGNTNTVGLSIRKRASSTQDLLTFFDTDGTTVRGRLDSDFRLTLTSLTVLSGAEAVFQGGASFTGELSAPSLYLTGTDPGNTPLTIKLASGQTADAIRVLRASDNTPLFRVDKDGYVQIANLIVSGEIVTASNEATSALNLSGVTGSDVSVGTGLGDKIALHANYGFGMQSSRLVAYVDPAAAFAVRVKASSGNKSSGPDVITLSGTGLITASSGVFSGSLTAGSITAGTATIGGNLVVQGTFTSNGGNTTLDQATISSLTWGTATSLTKLNLRGAGITPSLQISDTTAGAVTPHKHLRVRSGLLEILNSAQSAAIFTLTDAGALLMPSSITGSQLRAVGFSTVANGLEVGSGTGSAFVDFRPSNAPDFDARILARANTLGSNGGSDLEIRAGNIISLANLVMADKKIVLRGLGDDNHTIAYASDINGVKIRGTNGFAVDATSGTDVRLITSNVSGTNFHGRDVFAGSFHGQHFRSSGRYYGPVNGQGAVLNTKGGQAAEIVYNSSTQHIEFYINSSLILSAHQGSTITGGFSKSFVIQHPLERERYLVHSALEGPTADVYYRGECEVDMDTLEGYVELPGYFEAATKSEGRSVLLTVLDDDTDVFALVKASAIVQGVFRIRASAPCRVAWEVKAERADVKPYEIEPLKSSKRLSGFGPYVFLRDKD